MNINLIEFRSCIARLEAEFEQLNLDKINLYTEFEDYDIGIRSEMLFVSLYVENPHDDFWVEEFAEDYSYQVTRNESVFLLHNDKSAFFLQLRGSMHTITIEEIWENLYKTFGYK